MHCPSCGSKQVRRSLRRGLREGLLLRLALRAPYRCFNCGTRYFASSLDPQFRSRKKHRTFASYLGLRGAQVRKYRRAFAILILFVALIAVASWLVVRLSEPGAPTPLP